VLPAVILLQGITTLGCSGWPRTLGDLPGEIRGCSGDQQFGTVAVLIDDVAFMIDEDRGINQRPHLLGKAIIYVTVIRIMSCCTCHSFMENLQLGLFGTNTPTSELLLL
jgi:hypothetical protein